MVSLNCWEVLSNCLDSLRNCDPSVTHEIILVDNGSTDGTRDRIPVQYPEVQLIKSESNIGFLRATNRGIQESQGRFVLWLNPDTILKPHSLRALVDFLEGHPKAGIVGPKVLNADQSFQPQCKRGLPTPAAAFAYMLKLDRIWPNHPVLGQYLLRYRSPDEQTQVDSVSGCCLMARREVVETIGLLDEDLRQWGEDIEWCVRARRNGWEVWYEPASIITHLKGQGGRHAVPYHVAKNMHYAMWVFYSKYFRANSSLPTTVVVKVGITLSLWVTMARIWMQRNLLADRPAPRRPSWPTPAAASGGEPRGSS